MKEKIIVALDFSKKSQALEIVNKLEPYINFYKVGLELYTSCGIEIINALKEKNLKVFLDLKLHDIPNTVSNAIKNIAKCKPDFLTVHALGGEEMLKEAVSAVKSESPKTKILGVTVLTSLDDNNLRAMGIDANVDSLVSNLSQIVFNSGCDGLVCSVKDLDKFKDKFSQMIYVTPGIRLADDILSDQKRVATPKEAFEAGADYIVIGRSITQNSDPLRTLKSINENL